ncbi:hypothetical protein VP1G_08600 [Cytospora mali]|uniref:Uncharacterized protein n=1 Tax=Cytospora mali TaxID=578113 RepID=A0A194VC09_CYTMA|nr:hypothetical protein VP1G_08600 [Valsa mali var. pyri (nom. inval.)]
MARTNQELWKQPPASLNVEWPTDSSLHQGPTFEEQKARMRETRAKLSNAIAASGFPVPIWPDVGKPVNWNFSQHTSVGEGTTDVHSAAGGHASQPSLSRIPLRYQTSTPVPKARYPIRRGQGTGGQTSNSVQSSPLSRFPLRPRARTQENTPTDSFAKILGVHDVLEDPRSFDLSKSFGVQIDLPDNIDPSIANPHVFVVELPDPVFLRTPPTAPRAMRERIASMSVSQQSGRARMNSEATATTNQSYETAATRPRGDSSITINSHNSFEPGESFKTPMTHISPMALTNSAQGPSSMALTCLNRQGHDTSCSIGSPSDFRSHSATKTALDIVSPPGFENSYTEFGDYAGSWTYSKDWISEEERLRTNFVRLQEMAYHIDMDRSPFLPKTVIEYAALLAEKKDAEAKRARKRIQYTEEAVHNCHDEGTALPLNSVGLFGGKKMTDGLSSVLAMESCFNELPDTPEHERVDWPPNSEFRSWKASRPTPGIRGRRNSHRGAWPFPRFNMPFKPEETFDDGEIPYNKRKMVFAPRWDWAPKFVKVNDEESHLPAEEIPMSFLWMMNPILARLIKDIQRRPPQDL